MIKQISTVDLLKELTIRQGQNTVAEAQLRIQSLEDEVFRLGRRLHDAENGKSQFLSNVRNEVNNPLSAIIGLASSITGLTSEEKIRHMSILIETQAADLNFQMRNVIMAAEIEAGDLALNVSRVEMENLIEGQIASLRYRIEKIGVRVDATIEDRLKVRSDANILEIICANLLSNAIEYCGNTKNVRIDAKRGDKGLIISVRDFGNGIEPKLQSELFQRFQQGESGLRKSHGGHGLGLCLVKELVSHLDGSIDIQSGPGQGTIITVVIPEVEDGFAESQLSFGSELLFTEGETF